MSTIKENDVFLLAFQKTMEFNETGFPYKPRFSTSTTALPTMRPLSNRKPSIPVYDYSRLYIPGEGTEKLINRNEEKKSTELACSLEIDTKLYYFGQDGVKVMEFISDTRPMDENVLKQEEVVKQAAEIFHKLHT